jgi:dephospho-CoA kinase
MIVGLTGGIGTGKSTVGRMFRDLGATLVSADDLGHQAMHSTGAAYQAIIDRFADSIPALIKPDGEIDRRVLGYHVYLNPSELIDLEKIVHPAVEKLFLDFVKKLDYDNTLIVYECAILFEHCIDLRLNPPMACTIATWCPEETQITRIMQRDNLDRSEVLQRIEKQMPADVKRDLADFTIDTSTDVMDQVANILLTIIQTSK